ncbi:MAG: hypothetical protein ACT4PZ_13250 [Panacagrimonas sp.]
MSTSREHPTEHRVTAWPKAALAGVAMGLLAATGSAQAQLLQNVVGGLLGGKKDTATTESTTAKERREERREERQEARDNNKTGKTAVTTAAAVGAPAAINKDTGLPIPDGSVLLVWSSDGCALPTCNAATAQDFLAVLDVEPNSTTFGNVIWTAELPRVLVSNILPNLAGARSDIHNDPHHMLSYTSYISGGGDGLTAKRKYTLAGGVISKNVFRFDITSVRSIGKADIAVCGTQPRRSSLTDDFIVMPAPGDNHKILYTYMGNYVYGPQGTVTEIDPGRVAPTLLGICTAAVPAIVPLLQTVTQLGCIGGTAPDDTKLLGHNGITEYPACVRANQPRNPTIYTSSPDTRKQRSRNQGLFFLGNKDAGIEAQPHGMGLTYDGKYLATSDYAVPASIGLAALNGVVGALCGNLGGSGKPGLSNTPLGLCASSFGSSVRVWETSNSYTKGKTKDSLKPANVYNSNKYLRSVSAVPDGPRREPILIHEENEGLMAFGLPHQSHHCVGQKGWVNNGDPSFDVAVTAAGVTANNTSPISATDCAEGDPDYVPHDGAFTAAMCGGVLFYSPDITIAGNQPNAFGGLGPYWRAVYDVGPCTGVSYFTISDDDRFLIQPVSGIESPASIDPAGSADFDRDYPREHSRRLLTVDIRPLLSKGRADTEATKIECDYPEADASRKANTSLGVAALRADLSGGVTGQFNILKHNNEADDCPRIRGAIGQFETGPHGVGLPTTASNNSSQPGTGYPRFAELVPELLQLNLGGIVLGPQKTGGEPSGDSSGPGSGNLNSLQNLHTHGGPHFTLYDRIGYQETLDGTGGYLDLSPSPLGTPRDSVVGEQPATGTGRFTFIQYFVELNHIGGAGTGSDGDRTVCLGKFDRATGATVLDTTFTDELLGTPCVDFDSAARDAWTWPGARGLKGGAKPHSAAFERDGAALFGPGYYPKTPLNPDGDL